MAPAWWRSASRLRPTATFGGRRNQPQADGQATRSSGCARDWRSCFRGRWCWGRSRWTCSPCCWAGRRALLPVFARDILHVGPQGLGALRSATAVGATCTALLLARVPDEPPHRPRMFAAVALFGVATIVFGLSRNMYLSMGGPDRAGRGRSDQRLRALLADSAGHAGCHARPGQRRQHAVHRRLQ